MIFPQGYTGAVLGSSKIDQVSLVTEHIFDVDKSMSCDRVIDFHFPHQQPEETTECENV